MSGTIKGFFFDLDGTLIDTKQANFTAYSEAIYSELGINITTEDYDKTHGMSYKEFLPILIPDIKIGQIESISIRKKVLYKKQMHLTKANDFLVNFLKRMKNDNVIVLVTTAKKYSALHVLDEHNLNNLFDYMVFGEDVEHMKPDPEAYLKALKISNLKAEEVIAFEDSLVGIEAANMAGISTVHIRSFF